MSLGLCAGQMRQLPLVEQAVGRQTLAQLGPLDAACAVDDLKRAVTERFQTALPYARAHYDPRRDADDRHAA
jgi:hypothetical protein